MNQERMEPAKQWIKVMMMMMMIKAERERREEMGGGKGVGGGEARTEMKVVECKAKQSKAMCR